MAHRYSLYELIDEVPPDWSSFNLHSSVYAYERLVRYGDGVAGAYYVGPDGPDGSAWVLDWSPIPEHLGRWDPRALDGEPVGPWPTAYAAMAALDDWLETVDLPLPPAPTL